VGTATVPDFTLLCLSFHEEIRDFLVGWFFIFKQFRFFICGLFFLRWVPDILRFELNRIEQLDIALKTGNQQPQLRSIHNLGDLANLGFLFYFLRALILLRKFIHQNVVIKAALLIDSGWLGSQTYDQVTWHFVDANIDTHRHELVVGVDLVTGYVCEWLYVSAYNGVYRYLRDKSKHNQVARFKVRETDRVGLMMRGLFAGGLIRNHFLYWC